MTTTTIPTQYLTLEEYLTSEDEGDRRCELENGIRTEMPPESDQNNDIAKRLLFELAQHFSVARLGYKDTEIEVAGRRASCRIPDLLVHSEESKAALAGTKRATITRDMPPPALVVEVVSPGQINRDRDYRYKYTEYAARGIDEYWIVDPELQQITLCRWVNGLYESSVYQGEERLQSALIPNFSLTPAEIFAT
ncbi:MAG: Uma2 family endonuclease [Cyanothece sp. SIO2G6]|nr:Uma2 family endonuclease [Cyanothece sp. SIO2G6]